MNWSLKNWLRRYTLRHATLPDEAWRGAISGLSVLRGLSEDELERLRELAALFLNEKQMVAAGGFSLDDDTRIKIAAQACLPILNLGLDYYAGWVSVIVYPGEFVPEHEFMDEDGVVHVVRDAAMGESWEQGPVILSGADAVRCGEHDGVNVVIHELAHKLDMLNGAMNGFPPLHREMSAEQWAQTFTAAFADFCAKEERNMEMALDPYGAENPAEFFAVTSEAFFETPHILRQEYPEVYRQLAAFYRQYPAARRNSEKLS
ncbi:MAG: zinc-dependent peptidase [Nitrosomonadales bacterium]|nr:zinc-dependent peptidase [Nitrosomonadales bacterium]